MKGRKYEWTEAEIERLKDMRANGASYGDIARALNRSFSSVQRKGGTLGLTYEFKEHSAGAHREAQALIPRVDRSKMSLTALMLGDPPPGRSALDQGASA